MSSISIDREVSLLENYAGSALAWIEAELPGIDALSAMLNQRLRPNGDEYDVMDIGWRMTPAYIANFADNLSGADNVRLQVAVTTTTFYSHPDASKDWPEIALGEITLKSSKVLSIFAGYPSRVGIPGTTH